MKDHYHTYHDDKNILKNQDEEDAKEKPWKKNQNNDQDLKERINRKFFETNIPNNDFVYLLLIYSLLKQFKRYIIYSIC